MIPLFRRFVLVDNYVFDKMQRGGIPHVHQSQDAVVRCGAFAGGGIKQAGRTRAGENLQVGAVARLKSHGEFHDAN